jgi:hypothetical protein
VEDQMLNNIVDPDKTTFGIFNCEQLFRDVWDGYFADAMDEKWIVARRTGRRVGKGKTPTVRVRASWSPRLHA